MSRALQLALRILGREWRSGDLSVLFLALLIAVGAFTGVGFIVDRIDRAMQLQASEVLGADLRLQSPNPIEGAYDEEARQRGLEAARVTTMLSVVLKGEATQLSNVHAVNSRYPLRGRVKVSDQAFGVPQPAHEVPGPGEAWPDSRLVAALGARVGDRITVGAAEFSVTRILISRPDQGSGFVDLAPSVIINDSDLAATQLIQPGSRVRYAALYAGSRSAAAQFAQWLEANRKPAERLRDIAEASPEVGNASTRAARFLSLASLVSVLLCAVAIAMTARRYVSRHQDMAALMKTLGATRRFVLIVSLVQLGCIALVATLLGALAGFIVQAWLLIALKDLIASELPPPGWQPVWLGLATALLLLVGFALPHMLRLARVPAIRVLRRDIGAPPLTVLLAFGPALLVMVVLILWVTGDGKLASWFALGLAGLTLVLAGGGLLLVRVAGTMRGRVGVAWRYGVANLARRRAESVVQIVALGLGLSALLLLAVIRGDLIANWRDSLPRSAPNYFFVNIPSEEREAFVRYIEAEGGQMSRVLPMIRGRMTHINGRPVAEISFATSRGERFAQREQNLTWAAQIGPDNRITEGAWFTQADAGKPLVSVATDFQESMQLALGDRLTFDIAGETVEATVASFRKVKWDSLQPNFFLMFPPGLLEGAAGTYMASAQFRPSDPGTIARLVRQFPSVSIFDMDDLLAQVRALIEKAVLAVQSVFGGTLLAGIVVLLAAVQATRDERRYESAMLRTLGARRRTVRAGVLVEFALIGLLAGVLAAAAASIGGYFLATGLLDVPYRPNPLLWVMGAGAGALLVCLAGWLATRAALNQPPMAILRHG
ncbi:MAG: FtsX-like permease family protein [Steroidobacteraceae bacterium]